MSLVKYIKSQIKLSDIFKCYGEITGKGNQWFAHCHLHQDRTPSVSIRDDRGYWHCFSCNAKGDHITIVGYLEKLSFMESLDWLMKEFNIDPPERVYRDELRAQIQNLEKQGKIDEAIALLLGT
jgi:DNA primase